MLAHERRHEDDHGRIERSPRPPTAGRAGCRPRASSRQQRRRPRGRAKAARPARVRSRSVERRKADAEHGLQRRGAARPASCRSIRRASRCPAASQNRAKGQPPAIGRERARAPEDQRGERRGSPSSAATSAAARLGAEPSLGAPSQPGPGARGRRSGGRGGSIRRSPPGRSRRRNRARNPAGRRTRNRPSARSGSSRPAARRRCG